MPNIVVEVSGYEALKLGQQATNANGPKEKASHTRIRSDSAEFGCRTLNRTDLQREEDISEHKQAARASSKQGIEGC